MDNAQFNLLKNNIAALPVMEQRMVSLNGRISSAEDQLQRLLKKYQEEALDVDHIQSDSFSNTLLKLIGKYEGKVNKETQEMLSAKLEYDKAAEQLKELRAQKAELAEKIAELSKDKSAYNEEFRTRENLIKSKISEEAYLKYTDIQSEVDGLMQQRVEIDQAVNAAKQVENSASSALDHLKRAESWATYDVWGGGGILTHMGKYEHIDEAKAELDRLSYFIENFQKELSDINIYETFANTGIDSTTRAVDFWFDNIFTDMNVRDKIRDDIDRVRHLLDQINQVSRNLNLRRNELEKSLAVADARKKDLIFSFENS